MTGKKIDCYLDITSLFSYVAFEDLRRAIPKLAANGVDVEFHPVFLGGINHASGNKPPWMLPAKGKYLQYDSKRALHRVGLTDTVTPDLMKVGNTVIPLRALHYVRTNYSKETFLATLGAFLYTFWHGGPYANLSEEESLRRCLAAATDKHVDGSGKTLFTAADVQKILDGRPAMKQSLSDETAKALELGAFGAPWFWAVNGKGEGQPFFGSDRFNHMYIHLDIPFQDVAVQTPSKL